MGAKNDRIRKAQTTVETDALSALVTAPEVGPRTPALLRSASKFAHTLQTAAMATNGGFRSGLVGTFQRTDWNERHRRSNGRSKMSRQPSGVHHFHSRIT
jgi:hypothetical protein